MRDDPSERDGTGDGLECGVERIRRDRDDEPDPHVPRVEPLYLFEVAEVREKREDRRDLPRLAVDPRSGALRQCAREIAFPPATGEVGDRVDVRDIAQGPELREIRAVNGE